MADKTQTKGPQSLSRILEPVASRFTTSKEETEQRERRLAEYTKEQQLLALREKRFNINRSLRELILPRYIEAKLNHFTKEFILDVVNADLLTGIVFVGQAGVGKTYAMCALARWMTKRGRNCVRVGWSMLGIEVRGTYSPTATSTEENIVRRLIKPDCLFIEDIGADKELNEKESAFAKRVLYVILDRRIELCLPTFISTNCNKANLAAKFDERIADRLNLFTWLAMTGKSKRGVKP
jgi:DNA replication protein DnaC